MVLSRLFVLSLFAIGFLIPIAFSKKANVIVFLADDLGYADLGCFGNDSLKTPNLDRLAANGVKLTHNLSPESICTPSRAAFLTGRYPIRTGLASNPDSVRVIVFTSARAGLPPSERTFANELRKVGYSTGMVGKWHLGVNCERNNDFCHHPLNHGFQYYYGMPFSNIRDCGNDDQDSSVVEFVISSWKRYTLLSVCTLTACSIMLFIFGKISKCTFAILLLISLSPVIVLFLQLYVIKSWNCVLMKNYDVVEQPIQLQNLTVRFTAEAMNFMEKNKNKPFLLFVSFAKVHTALFTTKAFEGHSGHSRFGDNVEEMDWSVGKIISALETLGLRNDTFVYFTSDNGPHLEEVTPDGEYHGGWKGLFRGGKGNSWEGGIRVPTIISWPSHLPKGIEVTEPTNSFDIFPTLLEIAGADLPKDRVIDGKTLMPLLTQQSNISSHEIMIHYCAKAVHAVRYRPRKGKEIYKAHFFTSKFTPGTEGCFDERGVCGCYGSSVIAHDPPLLFEITHDPGESFPLEHDSSHYKQVMDVINKAVEEHNKSVVEVPTELDSHLPSPRRQVCCNFPWCSCKENVSLPKHYWP